MPGDELERRTTAILYHSSVVGRISDMERLLFGLATVALAGWGFSLAPPPSMSLQSDVLPRWFFISMFSGTIASVYAALFMARTNFYEILLAIESDANTSAWGHATIYANRDRTHAEQIDYSLAAFVPLVAITVLMFAFAQFRAPADVRLVTLPGIVTLVAWTCAIVASVTSGYLSLRHLHSFLRNSRTSDRGKK